MSVADIEGWTKGLNKNATLADSLRSLTEAFAGWGDIGEPSQQALRKAAKRAEVVLKSRCTDPDMWRKGLDLFTLGLSCEEGSGNEETWQGYIDTCTEQLTDQPPPPTPAQQDQPGPSDNEMNMLNMLLRQSAAGPGDALGLGTGPSGLPGMLGGMGGLDMGLGGIEELLGAGGPSEGGLPAAKSGLNDLKVEMVVEEGATCAVCQEVFPKRYRATHMPCGHPFHLECLKPWLEMRNSCPMCRDASLPTDEPEDVAAQRHRYHYQRRDFSGSYS